MDTKEADKNRVEEGADGEQGVVQGRVKKKHEM